MKTSLCTGSKAKKKNTIDRVRASAATLITALLILVLSVVPVSGKTSFKDIKIPDENGWTVWRTTVNAINTGGAGCIDPFVTAGSYLASYGTGTPTWFGFLSNGAVKLAFPGALGTSVSGINDNGRAVGAYSVKVADLYRTYGFVYSGGSYQQLVYPEGTNTAVLGINNNDDLVGWYTDASGTHGFKRISSAFTTLDAPGADPQHGGTSCKGINTNGQIVGTYYDSSENAHGFLYSGGSFTAIEYPGAVGGTEANGINSNGKIVGTWYDADYYAHGFVYNPANGSYIALNYPGSLDTYANGINDKGQVVGEWDDDNDNDNGFIATTGHSISGTVKKRDGTPVEEVTITLGGASSDTTTTAFDGTYSFSDLKEGSYTLTPSKGKSTFKPKVIHAALSSEDLESQDFTLQTFTISGVIKTKKGEPADGVSVALSGDSSDTTTTGSDGTYSFSDLENGHYTVTPTPNTDWYYINPPFKNVSINGKDAKNVNFTGKTPHDISGRILQGTDPVAGVTVTVTNTQSGWTAQGTTDADGSYEFKSLLDGSYLVRPSLGGFAFKPASRKVKLADSDVADVNFSAILLHSISGLVTVEGAPLSGVTITLTGKSKAKTTTGADGSYSFSNLLNGTYTVTPKMSGYTFTPTKISVTISNTDVAGQNFVGKAI